MITTAHAHKSGVIFHFFQELSLSETECSVIVATEPNSCTIRVVIQVLKQYNLVIFMKSFLFPIALGVAWLTSSMKIERLGSVTKLSTIFLRVTSPDHEKR